MELKKAQPTGTTSASGNSLQHEAAMRVEARFNAEERRRRHAQNVRRLKNLFLLFLFLFIVGGGLYAWRTGMLDALRPALGVKGSDVQQKPAEDTRGEKPSAPADSQKAIQVVERIEKHIDAFNEMTAKFAGCSVADWKDDASAKDKPTVNGPPLEYTALVPDDKGGCTFLELSLACDKSKAIKPMKIRKLMRTRGSEEVSGEVFNKMIDKTPFLVLREGRVYYCSAKPPQMTGLPVPVEGKPFNPSRHEFGALYDQVFAAKLAGTTFKYDVFLNHAQFKDKLLVATVAFGEEVSRERFAAAARAAIDHDEAVAAMLEFGKVDFCHAQKR